MIPRIQSGRERGQTQIAYRETNHHNAHGVGKLIKQSGVESVRTR